MDAALASIAHRSALLTFDGRAHRYTYDGERVKSSVSEIARSISVSFDSSKAASRCGAKKREQWTGDANCTDQQLMDAWKANGIAASDAGTRLHAQIEHRIKTRTRKSSDDCTLCPIISQWLTDYIPAEYTLTFPELRIAGTVCSGDDRLIAGTIDLLSYDTRDGTWTIWDWKRGSVSDSGGEYDTLGLRVRMTKRMIYSIQLSLYAKILQQSYGINVTSKYIVHTVEGTQPDVIECDQRAEELALIAALMRC